VFGFTPKYGTVLFFSLEIKNRCGPGAAFKVNFDVESSWATKKCSLPG
jgi:hypothetical protein